MYLCLICVQLGAIGQPFFSVDMVLAAGSSPLTLYLSSAPVPPSDTIKLALDIM